jgi:[ribosomal protein S5]-alanine N-acetyltransferase
MQKNFTLRNWQHSDISSLSYNANNIKIWNNLRDYFPFPYTEQNAKEFIDMVAAKPEPITDFAIVVNYQAVGGIGIKLNTDIERITAEIGYWLGEEQWNKGIMTEAIREMVAYSFSNFSLEKIYAPVFQYNKASQKVLEKAGFLLEAILKKGAIKNNKVVDLYYYSIFRNLP